MPLMPPTPDGPDSADEHVKPYVHDRDNARALHFSIGEIQSRMQLADPDALDLEYTRTMMGFLLFNAEPQDITMIGLGGGSLVKFCHRHLPLARIRVVEINPHVIDLREAFHVPPDDARLRVLCDDGARFVREHSGTCDVLMVDGFDSEGMPSQLASRRFYDDCREMLAPEGMLVVNLHAGHARYEIHLDRIGRSFDDAMLTVEDTHRGNGVVFAFKSGGLAANRGGMLRRPKNLPAEAAVQLQSAFDAVAMALRSSTFNPPSAIGGDAIGERRVAAPRIRRGNPV